MKRKGKYKDRLLEDLAWIVETYQGERMSPTRARNSKDAAELLRNELFRLFDYRYPEEELRGRPRSVKLLSSTAEPSPAAPPVGTHERE